MPAQACFARPTDSPAFARPAFHMALLAAGTLFFLTTAFHGNVWFDESYSIGIADKSFSEIWRIGSSDVHPVLFYWGLHVVNLLFGDSVLAYRLFAVAGATALAVLGYTHVRRDFGWRTGVLFSFLAIFTPYVALMAVEIRMYSWATFAVALCFLYALRISRAIEEGTRVTAEYWAVFFAASLASAYLHYFGVLSAFAVNVLLLAFLVVRRRRCGRNLLVFLGCAAVQVVLYLPWLSELIGQVGVVSNTYWANLVFPDTYIELATYQFLTSPVSFALRGEYGVFAQAAACVLCVLLLIAVLAVAVCLVRRPGSLRSGRLKARRARRDAGHCLVGVGADSQRRNEVVAAIAGFAVYASVYAMGWAASLAMDSLILYYRYLFVAIGPLLLACAVALGRVHSRVVVRGACSVVLCFGCLNQALLFHDDYSERNQEPLDYFQAAFAQVERANAEAGASKPLVLSSDIGIEGVTSVLMPEITQTYLDWQPGNWGLAYEAYGPTLSIVKSWEEALAGFEGRFVVLGQSSDGSIPRCVKDLASKPGVVEISSKTYYRPYERTYFTVAVMEHDPAVSGE